MRRYVGWLGVAGLLSAAIVAACSATDDNSSLDPGGNGATGAGATGAGAGLNGSGSSGIKLPDSGRPVDGGLDENGKPINVALEQPPCDGVDNDNDGIIDDIDVGGDGICDCLQVVTLGERISKGASQSDTTAFVGWLQGLGSLPPREVHNRVLTPVDLAGADVVVVQNIADKIYSSAELQILNDFVAGGGGVMTMAGYSGSDADANNVNNLLKRLQAPYYDSAGRGPGLWNSGQEGSVSITGFTPAHPISTNVNAVGVYYGYPVTGGPTDSLTVASDGLGIVGKTSTLGKGKVFVWADEWITFSSDWTQRPTYSVPNFWANTMKFLSPDGECKVEIPKVVPIILK